MDDKLDPKNLSEARKIIEEQQRLLDKQNDEIVELRAKGEGYLIVSNNPMYDEKTLGVQFSQGMAFIQKSRHFDMPKPMKDTQLAKFSKEEQEKIREREAQTAAERIIEQFKTDFEGYTVIEFDGSDEDNKRMSELISQQAQDYATAFEMAEKARKELENFTSPSIVQAIAGT